MWLLVAEAALRGAPPDPYVGPFVGSYARPQAVEGLVLAPPPVEDGGPLAWAFPPGQEHASFNKDSWSWELDDAPPPVATPAAEPAAAAPAGESCVALEKAGKEKYPDTLVECHPRSFYSDGVFDAVASGCTCTSRTLACPFTTRAVRAAWDACLDGTASGLGFETVSQQTLALTTGYRHHAPHLALCTFWRPRPAHHALPAFPADEVTFPTRIGHATFGSVPLGPCSEATSTAEGQREVKDALKAALGGGSIEVLFFLCGTGEADFVGAVDEVEAAEAAAREEGFCFAVGAGEVCRAARS